MRSSWAAWAMPWGCIPEQWSCKSRALRIPARSLQLFTYIALILQFLWWNALRARIAFSLQEGLKHVQLYFKQRAWSGTVWSLSPGQTQEHQAAKCYSKIKSIRYFTGCKNKLVDDDSTWNTALAKDIQFGKTDHTVCIIFPPVSSVEKGQNPDNDGPK